MEFFGPSTTKWQPSKIFAKLKCFQIANVFKLHKCPTSVLLKVHNMGTVWFVNNKSSLWKILFYNKQAVENTIFYFLLYSFFQILNVCCQNLMEKPSTFKIYFEGSFEVLLRHKYFRSTYFWWWNDGPFKFFWNFHGNAFCFFISSKWKKYDNLTSEDTFKMYCCALC